MMQITPQLIVNEATKAIEFYRLAFGAIVVNRRDTPDGRVMYAFLQVGDSMIAVSDEFTGEQACGTVFPSTSKGSAALLHMDVEDADAVFQKALQAGAKAVMPVENRFWGGRYGQLDDPFGHRWSISTYVR